MKVTRSSARLFNTSHTLQSTPDMGKILQSYSRNDLFADSCDDDAGLTLDTCSWLRHILCEPRSAARTLRLTYTDV